jgi:hypothetical protein
MPTQLNRFLIFWSGFFITSYDKLFVQCTPLREVFVVGLLNSPLI